MKRLKVWMVGYRQWALDIYKRLLDAGIERDVDVDLVITSSKPQADFASLGKRMATFDSDDEFKAKFPQMVRDGKPDVVLLYSWSVIVPAEAVENSICLCLHPSPLPRYRGGAPIQNQIIAGEKESAVSIFRMTPKIDQGEIYVQEPMSLEGDLQDVLDRMVDAGVRGTLSMLERFKKGDFSGTPQDPEKVTKCKRRTPDQSELTIEDFRNKTAEELHDFVRALQDPYPNAFLRCKDGKRLLFKKTAVADDGRLGVDTGFG